VYGYISSMFIYVDLYVSLMMIKPKHVDEQTNRKYYTFKIIL
jgi:hypothetical protein